MAKRRQAGGSALDSVGAGLSVAGRWLGHAAAEAGRSIATAYRAVDPDVRRHVAQLPFAGLSLLASRELPVAPLPDDGHPPLLFVHGLGGNRGNFIGMQALLKLSGRKRSYSIGFPPGATLEDMALAVRGAIQDIIRVNALSKKDPIEVVAHSMGGLVARLALVDRATRSRVRTLVTLGTPHGGTFAARFGATAHLLELRPGSATLRTLQRQLPWKGKPRLVCFWSGSDVFLLPSSSACVEGAQNIELKGFTHYSYLIHPRASQAVLDALAPGAIGAG
ncbi:MAG: esterase/lipase family protein [Myxococcaceae bacterium]